MERLQKVIAASGVCSRRHAEELILASKVKVNGEVINVLGTKVEDNDVIEIDGKVLKREKLVYYLLNKPEGVITTCSDTHGRTTILDCIDTEERVYAVGRLDQDTTGLIVLTNDGDLDYKLMHPKFEISKTYVAECKGNLDDEIVSVLTKGIILEDGPCRALNAKVIGKKNNNTIVELEINIGKKHIVKRMIEYLGSKVLKLHRKKIAFLEDNNLKVGYYRKLTDEEVRKLKEL